MALPFKVKEKKDHNRRGGYCLRQSAQAGVHGFPQAESNPEKVMWFQ